MALKPAGRLWAESRAGKPSLCGENAADRAEALGQNSSRTGAGIGIGIGTAVDTALDSALDSALEAGADTGFRTGIRTGRGRAERDGN